VLVVLAIAALAILACVVLVSLGRGGELTEFPPDVPPLDLPEPGQLTAVDFMALQLPVNLVGYHTQSVDETLRRAATAISSRDTRIAVLEQRVSELLSSRLYARQEVYAAPGDGLRTDHAPPASPMELSEDGDPAALVTREDAEAKPDETLTPEPEDAIEPPAVEPSEAVESAEAIESAEAGAADKADESGQPAEPGETVGAKQATDTDDTDGTTADADSGDSEHDAEPVRAAVSEAGDGDERK
jgi:hypothetical protein